MNKNQTTNNSTKDTSYVSGYKVIQINMNTSTDNLYAVVTPVKMKE
jgi:hypothetical protein